MTLRCTPLAIRQRRRSVAQVLEPDGGSPARLTSVHPLGQVRGVDGGAVGADEDTPRIDSFVACGQVPFAFQAFARGVGAQDAHRVLVQRDDPGAGG